MALATTAVNVVLANSSYTVPAGKTFIYSARLMVDPTSIAASQSSKLGNCTLYFFPAMTSVGSAAFSGTSYVEAKPLVANAGDVITQAYIIGTAPIAISGFLY